MKRSRLLAEARAEFFCWAGSNKINSGLSAHYKAFRRGDCQTFFQTKEAQIWVAVFQQTHQLGSKAANWTKKYALQRIREAGVSSENCESIYQKCIDLIKNHSVVTVTFDAGFLQKSPLTDFRLLNMWQHNSNQQTGEYQVHRRHCERGTFDHLDSSVAKQFFSNDAVKPRYGVLRLLDNGAHIESTRNFGKSFIVFRPVVALKSLFIAGDSLSYYSPGEQCLTPCTLDHVERLLAEFTPKQLASFVDKASHQQNCFLPSFDQKTWKPDEGGYIEALLRPLNLLLHRSRVEHIHVDTQEYEMQASELASMRAMEISISNSAESPYKELNDGFLQAIQENNFSKVQELVRAFPSLMRISDAEGRSTLQIAEACGSHEVSAILSHQRSLWPYALDIARDSKIACRP